MVKEKESAFGRRNRIVGLAESVVPVVKNW